MRRWTAQLFIEPFFPFNDLRPLPFDTLTNPGPSFVPIGLVCLSRFLNTAFIRRYSVDVAGWHIAHQYHFLILETVALTAKSWEICPKSAAHAPRSPNARVRVYHKQVTGCFVLQSNCTFTRNDIQVPKPEMNRFRGKA